MSNISTNWNYLLNWVPRVIDVAPALNQNIDVTIPNPNESFNYNSEYKIISILKDWINKFSKYLIENKDEEVSAKEFLSLVNIELSKKSLIEKSELQELRKTWEEVNKINYSKQDEKINKLLEENSKKFDTLKSIIELELKKNKKLKQNFNKFKTNDFVKKVSNDTRDDIKAYNWLLDKYNKSFAKATINLVTWENKQAKELKQMWELSFNKTLNSLSKFKNTRKISRLLTADTSDNKNQTSWNSCKQTNSKDTRYNYEWIYVLEWGTSYNLFDYMSELSWDEETVAIDFDNDRDSDLLYLVNWDLYLKQNYWNQNNNKKYFTWKPLVLDSKDNKFVNWDIFYEAINNFRETISQNNIINLNFSASTRPEINKYRVEYYSIIDKYLDEENSDNIKKSIIDAYNSVDKYNINFEDKEFLISKNRSYISNIWRIPWVKFYTKEIINISDSLKDWNIVNLSSDTILYAWKNNFTLKYRNSSYDDEIKEVKVEKYSNIKFDNNIEIIWISGNAYKITSDDILLEWAEIRKYQNLPLSFESKIEVDDYSKLTESSHLTIRYSDDTKLDIDLRKTWFYQVYDLWYKSEDYSINLKIPNDYLYSRIFVFKDNIAWVKSSQALLSPQKESDKLSPEINFNSAIRIPVYQKKLIDFTNHIYDDSWIEFISDIQVSWLEQNEYSSRNSKWKIRYEFWPFNKLFKKKITLSLTDNNWNKSSKNIDFEVYSPEPEIHNYENWKIIWAIDEKLNWEPISIYNYRWWIIKKLKTKSWETKVSTDKWNYIFKVWKNNLWLNFKVDWKKIANINEKTWKINILNKSLYNIKSELDSQNFVNIFIENKLWEKIFYEKLIFEKHNLINYVSTFDSIEKNWIYFNINEIENYNYYKIPENAIYNSWEIFIYNSLDDKKKPLLVIYKDWRINFLNNNFKLIYDNLWDYIFIKIIDSNNKEILKILYKIDNTYLIR
jgi:hypothetical protein